VDVDVDDRDPLQPAGSACRRGNSGVVIETKAHRPVAFCVMSRRPNHRENRILCRKRILNGLNGGASGQQRDRFRVSGGESVGVEYGGMARCSLNRRYVFWRVRGGQLLTRGRPRSHNSAALLQPVGGNRIEHVCALGPLWVTRRGNVILETRG
jgi:hypothetical protein